MCSLRIEVPERLVTGARPDVGGELGPGLEGLAQCFGQEDDCSPDPDTGHGWSGPGRRGWATRQGLDLGGDVSTLGTVGDELAGQVGQDGAGGLGGGDDYRLPGQGVDDGPGPGGVAAEPVSHRSWLCLPFSGRRA